MSARSPIVNSISSTSRPKIPSLTRLSHPTSNKEQTVSLQENTSRNPGSSYEVERVRKLLGMEPQDPKELLKEHRQENPRRSSSLVPTKKENKPISDPESAKRSSLTLTLNMKAVQNVPSPFYNDDICDLVSWYSIHHSKEQDMNLMIKVHEYRTRAWNFIAERMSYSHYDQKPLYHNIPDIDKVGDKEFQLRDYSFKYIDVETNNEIIVECNIFNGSKALEAGSKSTRTPQSDIDATFSLPWNISEYGFLDLRERFLQAVKDVRVPCGLSLDMNFYVKCLTKHPVTKSIDSLDLVTSEILTKYECNERTVYQIKAFMLKSAIQIGDMEKDIPKLSSSQGLLKVAQNAARWYEMLHVTDHTKDKKTKWSSVCGFIQARADLELDLYGDQFNYALETRSIATEILNDSTYENCGKEVDDLLSSYTAYALMRLEGYVSPYSTIQVVERANTRTLSSQALLAASIEQLTDSLVKASGKRSGEDLLEPTGMKPKTIGRLANILTSSRSEVIDNSLLIGIPKLIDDARSRLSAAVALSPSEDPQRAEKVEREEIFLEQATRVVLEAIIADLKTPNGQCDDPACTRLFETQKNPEEALKPQSEDERGRLTNAAVARLLIESIRGLINTLGMSDALSASVLILVEHLDDIESETMKAKRNKFEADVINESIEKRKNAGKNTPSDDVPLNDLASYTRWLTEQSLL